MHLASHLRVTCESYSPPSAAWWLGASRLAICSALRAHAGSVARNFGRQLISESDRRGANMAGGASRRRICCAPSRILSKLCMNSTEIPPFPPPPMLDLRYFARESQISIIPCNFSTEMTPSKKTRISCPFGLPPRGQSKGTRISCLFGRGENP